MCVGVDVGGWVSVGGGDAEWFICNYLYTGKVISLLGSVIMYTDEVYYRLQLSRLNYNIMCHASN